MRRAALALLLLGALALIAAGCGGSSNNDGSPASTSTGTTTLTVYASLPLQGLDADLSRDVSDAEKLALAERGGRVGPFTVKYRLLDDSTASAGGWDAAQTSSNARKAAQDKSTIAYLGESDSGASAISIPILNEAGILEVSPASTMAGLTVATGADKGEPDKYYPSGKRNFARVVPNDVVQAAAQVEYQTRSGCTNTYVLNDGEVYGAAFAREFLLAAKAKHLTIAGTGATDPKAADYRSLAQDVKASGADCVLFAGTTTRNAAKVFEDLHTAMPGAKLFGTDGVAEAAFASTLGVSVQRRVRITTPALEPRLYPPAGQRFFRRFRATYHRTPEPMAIFGYETMSAVLQAIQNAHGQGNDRQAVINALFGLNDRTSALGTYSIDDAGDTSLKDYAGDRVENGRLVFDQRLKSPGG